MVRLSTRIAVLTVVLGLVASAWIVVTGTTRARLASAQTPQPFQSLKPTPSACTAGSQSLRVCRSDLQSCNDVCAARALDPTADVAGCTTACCNRFNVCLQLRNCRSLAINCN